MKSQEVILHKIMGHDKIPKFENMIVPIEVEVTKIFTSKTI